MYAADVQMQAPMQDDDDIFAISCESYPKD